MIVQQKIKMILLLLPLTFLHLGCTNDKAILTNIEKLQSMPICLCISDMLLLDNVESPICFSIDEKFPFRLILFIGPNECSTCALNSLSEWNVLLDLEKEKKVQLVFILNPKKKDLEQVISTYYSSGLKHPVMIDTCDIFTQNNPHIPEESLFHTFLINSDNNVVMVGNPIKNAKIQAMFERITTNRH